jgi:hypothetical protein
MKAGTVHEPLRAALYFGMFVTAAVALLPYISDFFITAYVAGAFASVWWAQRKHESLTFEDGARLGFSSGFYGLLAASAIYDSVWQFFHYQLWQWKNADRMFALLVGAVQNAFNPSTWLVITIQIIFCAIFAGAIGAPAGLLAVKLLQRPPRD